MASSAYEQTLQGTAVVVTLAASEGFVLTLNQGRFPWGQEGLNMTVHFDDATASNEYRISYSLTVGAPKWISGIGSPYTEEKAFIEFNRFNKMQFIADTAMDVVLLMGKSGGSLEDLDGVAL